MLNQRWMQLIIAQLLISIALVTWWGYLIISLASELGRATEIRRMILIEGAWFLAVLVVSSAALFWYYRRDALRVRGLHAFFAGMTHEWRTPIASIRLQAESLRDAGDDPLYQRRLLDRLLEETKRMELDLTRCLLLARTEGGASLHLGAMSSDQFIKVAQELCPSNLNMHVVLHQPVMMVVDVEALRVVVRNIFDNSLRHANATKIEVSIKEQPSAVQMIFSDDGPGFSGSDRRLGELFFRGVYSHGAGVGLYLVSRLTKGMGGFAVFRGEGGFTVELNLRKHSS